MNNLSIKHRMSRGVVVVVSDERCHSTTQLSIATADESYVCCVFCRQSVASICPRQQWRSVIVIINGNLD